MPSAPPAVPPVEAELMQKIKKKKYLQHDKTGDTSSVAGVPSKLRILAVDLPAFKSMIDRPCSVDNSVVFPDGVVKKKVRRAKVWHHTVFHSHPISPPPSLPPPEEQERQYHINPTDIFRSVLHEVWRACRGS